MQATLDLDEDIFLAANEIAALEGTTTGKALSDLARQALRLSAKAHTTRNGVPLLVPQPGALPVNLDEVNRLRDGAS